MIGAAGQIDRHGLDRRGEHLDGVDPLAPVSRWGFARKAFLLEAILTRQITSEAAMQAHGISAGELATWARAYRTSGRRALMLDWLARRRPGLAPPGPPARPLPREVPRLATPPKRSQENSKMSSDNPSSRKRSRAAVGRGGRT